MSWSIHCSNEFSIYNDTGCVPPLGELRNSHSNHCPHSAVQLRQATSLLNSQNLSRTRICREAQGRVKSPITRSYTCCKICRLVCPPAPQHGTYRRMRAQAWKIWDFLSLSSPAQAVQPPQITLSFRALISSIVLVLISLLHCPPNRNPKQGFWCK